MDKATRRQSRLDIERLHIAADRLNTLSESYMLAMGDIQIARQALKTISVWASCFRKDHVETDARHIHDRAMDALSLMYHK